MDSDLQFISQIFYGVCIRTLCWPVNNIHFWPSGGSFSSEATFSYWKTKKNKKTMQTKFRFSFKIFSHSYFLMIRSLTKFLVHYALPHLHGIILSPPCFTIDMVFYGWYTNISTGTELYFHLLSKWYAYSMYRLSLLFLVWLGIVSSVKGFLVCDFTIHSSLRHWLFWDSNSKFSLVIH